MLKKIRSLKPNFQKLERDEPWKGVRENAIPKREKVFIRGIQVTHGMKKQEAIDYYTRMRLTSQEAVKRLEKTVKKRLEKYASSDSGGKKVHIIFTVVDLKNTQETLKGKVERKIQRESKAEKSQKKIRKNKMFTIRKLTIVQWLKSPIVKQNIKSSYYNRIKRGHQHYPDADKYEINVGINSIKSQEYRRRHNRPRKYEGRVNEIK